MFQKIKVGDPFTLNEGAICAICVPLMGRGPYIVTGTLEMPYDLYTTDKIVSFDAIGKEYTVLLSEIEIDYDLRVNDHIDELKGILNAGLVDFKKYTEDFIGLVPDNDIKRIARNLEMIDVDEARDHCDSCHCCGCNQ